MGRDSLIIVLLYDVITWKCLLTFRDVNWKKEAQLRRDQKSSGVGRDEMCVLGRLWPLLTMEIMEKKLVFFWKKKQNE